MLTPLRPRSWDLRSHDLMRENVASSLSQLVWNSSLIKQSINLSCSGWLHLELHHANGLLVRKWALSLSSESSGVRKASSNAHFPKERNSQFARNRPVFHDQQKWQAQHPPVCVSNRGAGLEHDYVCLAELDWQALESCSLLGECWLTLRPQESQEWVPLGILFKADCSPSDSAF